MRILPTAISHRFASSRSDTPAPKPPQVIQGERLEDVCTLPVPGDLSAEPKRCLLNLADPQPMRKHTGVLPPQRESRPLVFDGIGPADVNQGYIGDCYLAAALASAAALSPGLIRDMLTDNNDGTYTVRFYDRETARAVLVTVDADLYGMYGTSSSDAWWPVIEKAYAQWKGSYDAIGKGGRSDEVIEEITGKEAYARRIWSADTLWQAVKTEVDAERPMVLSSGLDLFGLRLADTGVFARHAYSVLGYEESDGKRYVILRNPWGHSEPGDEGGDGVFKLTAEEVAERFVRYYAMSGPPRTALFERG